MVRQLLDNGVWKWVATGTVTLLALVFGVWVHGLQNDVAVARAESAQTEKRAKEERDQLRETTHSIENQLGGLKTDMSNVKDQAKDTNSRVRRIEDFLINDKRGR